MNKISVAKGKERKENIKKSISLIEGDIKEAIKKKKSDTLFIKVNALDTNFPLACTHPDALESVVEYFYDRFKKIIIGDNSFAFIKNKGGPYKTISKKFPKIQLSDLSEFEYEGIEFKTLHGIKKGKISLLPKKAFTISLALPKTHDTFVYTGCLKNMFGCVIKSRGSLHAMSVYERIFLNRYVKGNKFKWQNLTGVIKKTIPDLSVLDAYDGMENEGPIFGTKIHLGFAMCSLNGVALDRFAAEICGFPKIPYLQMLSDLPIESLEKTTVKSGFKNFNEITRKFRLHYNTKYQLKINSDFLTPLIDVMLLIFVLKRFYRIRDKIKNIF